MNINKDYILQLSKGLRQLEEGEKRKLEFKSRWHVLNGSDPQEIEEFCRDVTAMANTPGPEGYIIIGLHENSSLENSPISESGYGDESLIRGLLIKRVKPIIQFEIDVIRIPEENNVMISVIKIPPSYEKPHVMGSYRKYRNGKLVNEIPNYVPIRHGAGIFPADHRDYEYMYYDRKNIIADYDLGFLPIKQEITVNEKTKQRDTWLTMDRRFIVQNIGRYPIAISEAHLILTNLKPNVSIPKTEFIGTGDAWVRLYNDRVNNINNNLPTSPIIIPHNEMIEVRMEFWLEDLKKSLNNSLFAIWKQELKVLQSYSYSITLHSINDRIFSSEIWD